MYLFVLGTDLLFFLILFLVARHAELTTQT